MQSRWAKRRKIIIGIIFICIVLAIGAGIYFLFVRVPPSCSDGLQNQNEKGVDCGGICTRLCLSDIANPVVLWQRAFPVQSGLYSAVAYVNNPNLKTEVQDINYVFSFYDSKNVLIGERKGHTFIPVNQTFAIFESGINTGTSTISRTDFKFADIPIWAQLGGVSVLPKLSVSNITLTDEDSAPGLTASVFNASDDTISKLEAVAILYDTSGTAIGASRTIVSNLGSQRKSSVLFTWPHPFSASVIRKEIVLRAYPLALPQ